MEAKEIKALVVLMNEYGLVELEIEDKKGKVRLVRDGSAGLPAAAAMPTPRAVLVRGKPASAPGEQKPAARRRESAGAIELAPNQKLVESPMVGTFYRAPSPDSAPFVEEGASVRKGQTVCIIEAMKMMNEVEAPAAGRVARILAENGQAIEYGQALMILEVG